MMKKTYMESLLSQTERRQLGIFRSPCRKLALVQEKLAGRHRTKFRCRQCTELFLQVLKAAGRSIALLLARRSRMTATSRQRQMRVIRVLLSGNVERSQR